MPLVIADRVKETSTTTGTGTFTLAGVATGGFRTFASGIGSGNTCYYTISDGTNWEVGIGTVGTGTLARDTVYSSSNSGNKVDFPAGEKEVFVTYPAQSITNADTAVVGYTIDGDGDVITTGTLKPGLRFPFSGTIQSVTLLADVSGSIVVDIWKDTYANYPPTVADSICASAKPTLSSAIKSEDTTLTGWTKSIAAGDVLLFNVDSASTVKQVTVILKVTKT